MAVKFTQEDFIKKAESTHGGRYDYSKSVYTTALNKLIIICKDHGEFEQTASKHGDGQGCPKCKAVKLSNSNRDTREQFIEKALKTHGDTYGYEKVEYINQRTKVSIFCKYHSEDFLQTPADHLMKKGCPKCGHERGSMLQLGSTKETLNRMQSGAEYLTLNSDEYPNAGIYKIENTENGKKYIGSSVSVQARMNQHLAKLLKNSHGNIKLQNAFNAYGAEKFVFEVVEMCSAGDLLVEEQKYIDLYKCVEEGYNIQVVAGSHAGLKRSEETKEKMSVSQRGRVFSEEHRQNIASSMLGKKRKPHSEETKEKIRLSNIGKIRGPQSEETKAKRSAALKGIARGPVSEETRLKLSESHKGKSPSEETRQRLSESAKNYWSKLK